MARASWAVPILGGAASALLFLAITAGPPGMMVGYLMILGYLVPLPLFVSGLAFGLGGAGLASAVAATGIWLASNAVPAVTFCVMMAIPVLILVRQALLARENEDGTVDWYPPGKLVLWLTGMGLAALGAATLFLADPQIGIEERLRRAILSGMSSAAGGAQPSPVFQLVARLLADFPAVVPLSWLGMLAVNGILAQGLVARFGWNLRPSPAVETIELPWPLVGLTAATLGMALLLEGWLAFLGRNAFLILILAWFFAGLAVVHALARRLRHGSIVLVAFYAFLLLFGWPFIPLVAFLGLIEQWVRLRARLPRGPSPTV